MGDTKNMPLSSWAEFKDVCVTKKRLACQCRPAQSHDEGYDLFGPEDPFLWTVTIVPGVNDGDIADFESNYKAKFNGPLIQLDSDGASMSRVKVAPAGWSYQMRMLQLRTATIGSLVNSDVNNQPLTDAVLKFYDANNALVTDVGQQASIVKTVLDVEPPYDYYIASGQLRMYETVTQDVFVNFIGVPDVPAQAGGSKQFVQNVNVRFLNSFPLLEAGAPQAAKWLQYNAQYHTNKIRIVFFHPAGYQINVGAFLESYKL